MAGGVGNVAKSPRALAGGGGKRAGDQTIALAGKGERVNAACRFGRRCSTIR